jgi:hypothetical protein
MKFLPLLLCLCFVLSCKKECATPTYPISGLYEGTYTVDGLAGSFYYSLILKPDGRLITEGAGADGIRYIGTGNWTLSGTTLTYNTNPLHVTFSQTGTFTYQNTGDLTSGTWRDVGSPSNLKGTFPVMKRVN